MAVLITEKTALIIGNHGDEVYRLEKLLGTVNFRTLYGNAASPSRLRAYLLHDRVDWLIISAQHCSRNGKFLVFPNGQGLSMPDLLFNLPRFPEFVGLLACNTWKIGDCFRRNGTKLALVTGTDIVPADSYWPFTYLYIESLLQGLPAGAAFVQAQGRFQSLYPGDHTPWQFGLIGDYTFQMVQGFACYESQSTLQPGADDRVTDVVHEVRLNSMRHSQAALISSLEAVIFCPPTNLTHFSDDNFGKFDSITEHCPKHEREHYQSLFRAIRHLVHTWDQVSATENAANGMTEERRLEKSIDALLKTINLLSVLVTDSSSVLDVDLFSHLVKLYGTNKSAAQFLSFTEGNLPDDFNNRVNRIQRKSDNFIKRLALSHMNRDPALQFALMISRKQAERFSARQIIEIFKGITAKILNFCSTRFR